MTVSKSTTFPWTLATFITGYLLSLSSATKPYPLTWNVSHVFGYDGPWHAIPMKIGWPEQIINLYPGGAWSSVVLGSGLADSFGFKYPNQTWLESSEVWNASVSEPWRNGSTENYDIAGVNRGGVAGSLDGAWGGAAAMNMNGSSVQLTDRMTFATPDNGITIPNISLSAVYEANIQYPDGDLVPMDMGFLSLGAHDAQSWDPYVGNLIPNFLASKQLTPSNSWSLHIGSAALGIPGSLILGGYDATRAIGDIGTYDTTDGFGGMFGQVVDVQLNVGSSSSSPWPFRNKTNLLLNAKNETQTITARLNPTVPYLFLPNKTCEALAEYLPVTWRWDLGLYTWNTDDAKYREILTSPSYLQFVFARAGGQGPITIKVPLALLNLTLAPPIVDTETAYFPCRPYDNNGAEYHLGRAFLQAAFLGMNWVTSKWWLAQAPGPMALSSSIVNIENKTETISTSAPDSFFTESWKGVLKDIPSQSSSSPGSGETSSDREGSHSRDGLSGGAIAGIVVGASVAATLICTFGFLFWKRRARQDRLRAQQEVQHLHHGPNYHVKPADISVVQDPQELHGSQPPVYELTATESYR